MRPPGAGAAAPPADVECVILLSQTGIIMTRSEIPYADCAYIEAGLVAPAREDGGYGQDRQQQATDET